MAFAKNLHHIAVQGDICAFRHRSNFVHWLDNTSFIIGCHDRDKCSRLGHIINPSNCRCQHTQINNPIFINSNLMAILVRVSDRVMFDRACDHMIILRHHKIIGLGTTTGKHHIWSAASGKCCHRTTRHLNN